MKCTCKEDFHAVSKLSLGCHDLGNSVKNPIPHPFAAPGVPEALVYHGSCAHAFHPPSGWMISAPSLCMQAWYQDRNCRLDAEVARAVITGEHLAPLEVPSIWVLYPSITVPFWGRSVFYLQNCSPCSTTETAEAATNRK